MMKPFDLGKQSNPGRHPHAGIARMVNCFPISAGQEGKVATPLYAVSGLEDFTALPDTESGLRAMLATDTTLYAVAGRVVYAIDTGGSVTVLGGAPTDGHVFMAANGRQSGAQVGIVSDGLYYLIDGGAMALASDADLPPPNSIFYLGGYFFFTHPDGRYTWTALEDGSAIDGLDFDTASANPDGLVRGVARGRDAVLFGPRSTEIRTLNDGTGDTIVSARSAIGHGCYAAAGAVALHDTVLWPSTNSDGAFAGMRALEGDVPREIGNDAVNRIVGRSDPETITGTTWTEDGRTHVAWSGEGWTWVFDTQTGLWHERSSGNGERWRVAHCAQLGTRIIAGDATQPMLYRLGYDLDDEAGDELVMTLQPPQLTAYPGRIEVNQLFMDVIPGVGLANGATQDVNPVIAMRWSADNRTWSNELRRSLGRQGKGVERGAVWSGLGTQGANGRTYQFRVSAAVARGIMSAAWDGAILPP